MRCLGCKAWKDGKCIAGVVPYKSKKEADGVGCNCNTRTIDKKIREKGAASMGMYIPNMKSEQFYDLCKEHGLEIIAVPVPAHGRLGDLDALHKLFLEKAKEHKGAGGAMVAMAALCIATAPTIIPASEEGET